METNIILAGVGGQGIVSISYVIDMAALSQGLAFKQAEVHGMSQRGGAVQSHLRISDKEIHSDLVPKGTGSLVLAIEPLESLRYVDYLSPNGALVSGTDPFVNIADYGDVERVLDAISTIKNHTLVPADRLARQAGSARAQNMVLLGAASPFLGIREDLLERGITDAFARKGEKIQKTNVDAFRIGKAAGAAYRALIAAGVPSPYARVLVGRLNRGELSEPSIPLWKTVLTGPTAGAVAEILSSSTPGKFPGSADLPRAIVDAGESPVPRLQEILFKTTN